MKLPETGASADVLSAGLGVVLDHVVGQRQLLPQRRVTSQVLEAVTSLGQLHQLLHGQEAENVELELSREG